jgi:muconolactone delta-isomerase
MAQFLSLSRRKVAEFGADAFTPELVAAEGNRVQQMYAEGTLRQVWRRGDTAGAAILWEAADDAAARAALESLPLFQAGLLEIVSLVALHPYPGFGPK